MHAAPGCGRPVGLALLQLHLLIERAIRVGARQVDPGSGQAFVSAEDELIRRYLPRPVREALPHVLKSNLPGKEMLARHAFALAQRTAQGLAFKQRCSVLRSDSWLDEALSFAGQNVV